MCLQKISRGIGKCPVKPRSVAGCVWVLPCDQWHSAAQAWGEALNDDTVRRRARNITCQFVMIIFPIGLSGWMSYILFAMLTRTELVPFSQEELDSYATPPLLTAFK